MATKGSKTTSKKVTTKKTTRTNSKKEGVIEVKEPKKVGSKIKGFFKKIFNFIKSHKYIFGILSGLIVLIIFYLIYLSISLGFTVVTIDDTKFTKADLNMQLYNLKYSYFGKESYEIPDATLDEQITSLNMTVGEYLKQQAVEELKILTAVERIAEDNNISLSDEDYAELEENKEEVISNVGGKSEFKKLLIKNNITEAAYDKFYYINKLYDKVFEELYSSGKKNDLTTEEKESAKEEYFEKYLKIQQIVLAKIDVSTGSDLSDTIINQKETLANSILTEARNSADFEDLIIKYSEEAQEKGNNTYYYAKGDLLENIESVVVGLGTGSISDVIETDYAFHIVKRLELDDSKLENYYDIVRNNKLVDDIQDMIEDYKIFYENSYKKIK